MKKKEIDYERMFKNLKSRTEMMLEIYMKDLKLVTGKYDEVPDLYIGFKLGELHNQISTFRLEVLDFNDDEI